MKFHRCGWCGHPTDKNGKPIHKENPGQYVDDMNMAGLDEELVHGKCCPNGDPNRIPTIEMLIDAGII